MTRSRLRRAWSANSCSVPCSFCCLTSGACSRTASSEPYSWMSRCRRLRADARARRARCRRCPPSAPGRRSTWSGGTPNFSSTPSSSTRSTLGLARLHHVVEPHVVVDELVHVLVARDDPHVAPGRGALARERADDVVGLPARDGGGTACPRPRRHAGSSPAAAPSRRASSRGWPCSRGRPCAGTWAPARRRRRRSPRAPPARRSRSSGGEEAEDRARRLPLARLERAPQQGEVRAVGEGHAVEQEEAGAVGRGEGFGHGQGLWAGGRTSGRAL